MSDQLFVELNPSESDAIKGGNAAAPYLNTYLYGNTPGAPDTTSTTGGFNFSTAINVNNSFNQDNDNLNNVAAGNGNFIAGNGNPLAFIV